MMSILVSAIITTRNRRDLLPRAIDSVLNQTYHNLECIVVSDNSTDGTVEYCRARDDIRFINIDSAESRGGNHARNIGIEAARGEYVAFLDDDDYWLPEKIDKEVALIENKECDLVYCGRRLELVHSDGTVDMMDIYPDLLNSGDMSRRVLYNICTTTSAILVRKSALVEVGLFDENLKFWQEYELSIRLAQISPFYFVNEALIVYRVDLEDANRLTNKYYEWWNSVKYIRKKHRRLYASQTFAEWRKTKLLICHDAQARAKARGLSKEVKTLSMKMKMLRAPEILRDKIMGIFKKRKYKGAI